MEIKNVKSVDCGYLVNGQTFVPMDRLNMDYHKIQKWLDAGNVLLPEFTDTELMTLKLAEVDAECTRRIELYWNQVGQLNAALGVYSDETAAACKHWITANRNAREVLLARSDMLSIDVTKNEYWPELP